MQIAIARACVSRAVDVLGSERRLAATLHVTERNVQLWRAGCAQVPERVLLRAVDIIIESKLKELHGR